MDSRLEWLGVATFGQGSRVEIPDQGQSHVPIMNLRIQYAIYLQRDSQTGLDAKFTDWCVTRPRLSKW